MKCGGSCGSGHQTGLLTPETMQKSNRHPCYSEDAHHKYARMHLPVAPACNISCNYCCRKFDCVNESRPGVTSEVLSPEMAAEKFSVVQDSITNLSVVGIAGPGDALANWSQTRKSIELIKERAPKTVFCLSTNGLMLPQLADEIVGLGIRHVTVTVNALDPVIGALIYSHVIYQGKKYTGVEGARILLDNQLDGIKRLAGQGVAVKVNIVMIRGINDSHIPEIVKKAKELGAFMTNIMPLIPAAGSVFADYPQTGMKELNRMRDLCQLDLHQMRHCRQCRADAIGMLGEDRSAEFRQRMMKMANKIAVFLGEKDETASLREPGRIVIYSKSEGCWSILRGKALHVNTYGGLKELRSKTSELVDYLGDVKVLAAGSINGIPYYELEKAGFSLWEFAGRPDQFLDYILEQEEENARQPAAAGEHSNAPLPPVEIGDGRYYISLTEIQESSSGVTSKQALRPFLRKGEFYELEIDCKHVPPWLEAEMTVGSLTGKITRMGNARFKIIVGKKMCDKC
ncbi:MAG: nitrogenase cofactor biosynthesis protein NifB [Firmicutes bacterium HGW-Firmicutes-14]|nr:MAG: nitrogenase cofactor biosynthesis protein NifB [Firmicutes bacterium HGW-Firmicutes-14]